MTLWINLLPSLYKCLSQPALPNVPRRRSLVFQASILLESQIEFPAPQAPPRPGKLPRCQHELLTETFSNLSTSVLLRLGTYERVDNCQLPTTFCFLQYNLCLSPY